MRDGELANLFAVEPDGSCVVRNGDIPFRKCRESLVDEDPSRVEPSDGRLAGLRKGGLGNGMVSRYSRELERNNGAHGGINSVGGEYRQASGASHLDGLYLLGGYHSRRGENSEDGRETHSAQGRKRRDGFHNE